jgi:hypothetical protein
MFDFYCTECRRRQLIFASQVTKLINDERGISVIVTCWCGELGAIRTGAESATPGPARRSLQLAS